VGHLFENLENYPVLMDNCGMTGINGQLNWLSSNQFLPNIVSRQLINERPPTSIPLPNSLHPEIIECLRTRDISTLYSHQSEAYSLVGLGKNVVISTGTSSGKSLCYILPVLQGLLSNPESRALFLFPTKALANDQLNQINTLIPSSKKIHPSVYDGDTPNHLRPGIRSHSKLVISNPDMLHLGILPQHTIWSDFFINLRYIVMDEIHLYRGVFGSHIANVIRRLKRISAFYGSFPQFILTSGTIANPKEHAEALIETTVDWISEDGSPKCEKEFVIYNPPIVDEELGIRRSLQSELFDISSSLFEQNLQTMVFTHTRRFTEMLVRLMQKSYPAKISQIQGYRSGYLPAERRKIEAGLRNGDIRLVFTTNALELGVDIGGMQAVVIAGYPGSVSSTRQQSGRSGRRNSRSMSILITSFNPLDQYIARHPEFILERDPEMAVINPDNPLILLHHIRCAAFELSFSPHEKFGNLDPQMLEQFLLVLKNMGEIYAKADKYYWMSSQYPAEKVSLRSASIEPVLLQVAKEENYQIIGQVEEPASHWMVHPGAVYLHLGHSYLVKNLDLEKHVALLEDTETDYYTKAINDTEISLISLKEKQEIPGGVKHFGEIRVTTTVKAFRKLRWVSQELIEVEPLDLPPTYLNTTGCWIVPNETTIENLKNLGLWRSGQNDYGPKWNQLCLQIRTRDNFQCQSCGSYENGKQHHVHHKAPFKSFSDKLAANSPDNLITLCPACHRAAEQNVRIRSGLAGLQYILLNLSPLRILCDIEDLGSHSDSEAALTDKRPVVLIYDQAPAGVGLSRVIYENFPILLSDCRNAVKQCECPNGCPSCVGPIGEQGSGGKEETLALINALLG
jgi:DEAD/DEAH box helicase domain-containing protein